MKQTFIPFILSLIFTEASAQTPLIQKELKVGKEVGWGRENVVKCSDNGYVIAGNFEGIPREEFDDLCVIRTDASGNLKWRYVFKDFMNVDSDYPSFILETPDGGFLIGAYTSYDYYDNYLLKLDANGKLLWSKLISVGDKTTGGYRRLFGIITSGNNYLVVGSAKFQKLTYRDQYALYAMMIDNNGNMKWVKDYYKANFSTAPVGIVENKNKTFTIGCTSQIVTIDSSGNFISARDYKYKTAVPLFSTITSSPDHGFFLSGMSVWLINNAYYNYTYVVKTDKKGDINWARTLRNQGITTDISAYYNFKNSAPLPDNGCYVTGLTLADNNLALSRFDANGNLLWKKILPHADYKWAGQTALIQTNKSYMYYSGLYGGVPNQSYYLINEFGVTDSICNSIPDSASILVNENANSFAENLRLHIDSIGSLITIPKSQVLETDISTMSIDCSNIILPLQFISFSANHNNNTNLLKWSTAQELNTDRFEIQRSTNSRNFTTIGTVSSLNNGKNKNDYTYTDALPLKQVNYYRLKMIDKDGKFIYSAIKKVNNSSSFDVALYPNPVHQNLTLNFNTEKAIDVQVEIVNAEGKKVYSKEMQLPYGASLQTINVAAFKAGNYFVKFVTADGQTGLKFVKQ